MPIIVVYYQWPRKLADSLARILGVIMVLEGLGIYAYQCCELDIWVAAFLFFAGLEGILLPETDFWKNQFKKNKLKKNGKPKKKRKK